MAKTITSFIAASPDATTICVSTRLRRGVRKGLAEARPALPGRLPDSVAKGRWGAERLSFLGGLGRIPQSAVRATTSTAGTMPGHSPSRVQ